MLAVNRLTNLGLHDENERIANEQKKLNVRSVFGRSTSTQGGGVDKFVLVKTCLMFGASEKMTVSL